MRPTIGEEMRIMDEITTIPDADLDDLETVDEILGDLEE